MQLTEKQDSILHNTIEGIQISTHKILSIASDYYGNTDQEDKQTMLKKDSELLYKELRGTLNIKL